MTYQVGYDEPKPTKRKGRRAALIIVSVIAVLVVGALVAAMMYLNSLSSAYEENAQVFEESFPEEEGRPVKAEDDESINILLLGSDANGGSGESENLPDVPQGGRSDTMMFVHIPEDRDSVQIMSIPRDLWVEVPGQGQHKINAALSLGGLPLTISTIESLFDARIDHVAAVDMLGFTGLVDALGGVTVNSSYEESFTTGEGFTFQPGEQTMNSEEALSFVRHRKSFPDGDLQRVKNQQAFIRAVIDETLTPGNLSNPGRVQDMVETFSPHLIVDDTLDSSTVASLGWNMRGAANSVDMFTVPTDGNGYSADGQWIFYQDEAAMAEISSAIDDSTLDDYAASR
ncbi:LCP family protein [Nesterenkonia lutea]|uniref:LCP family protein required for cell wall assembly n=1 Tax=Nesterenkonia lutea TaxID=272919 RepID=A0ABR9JFD7_9MICC|nr:LCP family protein [Nesterenkonia lutea]MBE1524172.1 LCP family protein required for cell wall assembly [Nesterenkonia lutea]